jgi:hypothetical protein
MLVIWKTGSAVTESTIGVIIPRPSIVTHSLAVTCFRIENDSGDVFYGYHGRILENVL